MAGSNRRKRAAKDREQLKRLRRNPRLENDPNDPTYEPSTDASDVDNEAQRDEVMIALAMEVGVAQLAALRSGQAAQTDDVSDSDSNGELVAGTGGLEVEEVGALFTMKKVSLPGALGLAAR